MAAINAGSSLVEPIGVSSNTPNQAQFRIETVTVATAGTPVQGPVVSIPNNVALAIQADPNMGTNQRLYVANSSANALLAANRIELAKGQSIELHVTDASLVWFNASNNGVKAILMVEA